MAKVPGDPTLTTRVTSSRCGARIRKGQFCRLKAGHNTDHEGIGLCYKHGGNDENHLTSVGMRMAHEGEIDPNVHPGDVLEIEPMNALTWGVMLAGGDVAYWNEQVKILGEEIDAVMEADDDEYDEQEEEMLRRSLERAFAEQRKAAKEMRSSAKMALDAGVDEAQVRLAERMAGLLTSFARGLFARIEVKPEYEDALPTIIAEEVLALQAPESEVKPKPKQIMKGKGKKAKVYIDG